MGPIKDISGLPREYKKVEKEDDLKRIDALKKSGKKQSADKSGTKISDTVEISATGKNLLQQKKEISRYLEELDDLETISQKEIHNIRKKITKGFYSKPEVLEEIVKSILTLPAFQKIHLQKDQPLTDSGELKAYEDQLAEIREKIRKGEYDSDTIADAIAEKILKSGQL